MSAALPAPHDESLWTLEAWRGIAAWMVVYVHYHGLAGIDPPLLRMTFTGVDLFFVLSGFVFAPYLFGRRIEVRAFALRRFFRIYPAYVVALAVYVGLKMQAGIAPAYLWQHLVMGHLQSREMAFFYNPAFWSLPPEAEFYVFLPLLAAFTQGNRARFAALLATAAAARLALGHWSDPISATDLVFIWMHHLPGMLIEFLTGTCAWLLFLRVRTWRSRLLLTAAGVAGWLALAHAFGQWGDAGFNAGWARGQLGWLAALAFAAIVAGTARPPRRAPPVVVSAAKWAGRLSYGTYLLHFAALTLVTPYVPTLGAMGVVLLACLLTLTGSWLMYLLWENPWRMFGRRLAKPLSSPNESPALAPERLA